MLIHLRIARTHPSTGWPAVPCEREKHGSTSEFPLSVRLTLPCKVFGCNFQAGWSHQQVEQQCHASLTSWGVGSEKNRSNSKTNNTPWYLCTTEQLIIILARIKLNVEYLSWISLTNARRSACASARAHVNVTGDCRCHDTSKTAISIPQQ